MVIKTIKITEKQDTNLLLLTAEAKKVFLKPEQVKVPVSVPVSLAIKRGHQEVVDFLEVDT